MATGTIILPVEGGKISGTFITNPAGIDSGEGSWKLTFDASITESVLWVFRMPQDYSSGLVAKLQFSMASGTSGQIDLEIDVMSYTPEESGLGDIDTVSFDTINEISGGTTVSATAGLLIETSITLTNDDNVVAGDFVIIRLSRDHDDADDTATGDLELRTVSLEYTTT